MIALQKCVFVVFQSGLTYDDQVEADPAPAPELFWWHQHDYWAENVPRSGEAVMGDSNTVTKTDDATRRTGDAEW